MRVPITILGALLAGCAAPPPEAGSRHATELVGRVAGAPQRCLLIDPSTGLRVSDGDRHTLVSMSGKTLWGNYLGPGCGFGPNDILVFEPTGREYCRGDLVRSIDRYSKIPGPSCPLGDFIPYSRS
jgi:hypothetical protein